MTVPYYKQKKDALEEVGITARQESHWRQNGLYEPEIGEGRFTRQDIMTLDFLRRLIVTEDKKGRRGLGLSVDSVKYLLNQRTKWSTRDSEGNLSERLEPLVFLVDPRYIESHTRHIDFFSGKFVNSGELVNQFVSRIGGGELAERWAQNLAFLYFQSLRSQYRRDPAVYKAHRDRFLNGIRQMDLITRAMADEEEYSYGYSPALPDDPEPRRESGVPYDDPIFQKFQAMEHESDRRKRRLEKLSGRGDYDLDREFMEVPF